MTNRVPFTLMAGLLGVLATAPIASAQRQQQGRDQDGIPSQALAPREVQQLLDGYAVIQGQEFLGLNDTQFAQFLPKFRALQETRRRNEMERLRLLQELNRMTNPRAAQRGAAQRGADQLADDNDVRDRLRALKDVEARSAADLLKARDAIDQTLDMRQQARFRLFEEQIELRKLQLLMQVRQNRANRQLAKPAP
jgi:hypothetical protein